MTNLRALIQEIIKEEANSFKKLSTTLSDESNMFDPLSVADIEASTAPDVLHNTYELTICSEDGECKTQSFKDEHEARFHQKNAANKIYRKMQSNKSFPANALHSIKKK